MDYNWEPATLSRLKNKAIELAETLIQHPIPQNVSLLGGKCGIAIALFLYDEYAEEELAYDKAVNLLNDVLEEVQNVALSFRLSDGLAGIGWGLNYLLKKEFLDEEIEEMLEMIDQVLLKYLPYFEGDEEFKYDYLHGLFGLLLYFSERSTKAAEDAIQRTLALLKKHAISDEEGGLKWLSISPLDQTACYNFSLSHGMSSIIALLTKLIRQEKFNTEDNRAILNGACQYIMGHCYEEPTQHFFPNIVLAKPSENQNKKPSRLAWCYGDLGTTYTLLKAARAMNEQALEEQALYILKKSTERREVEANLVNDAGVCHGAFGIALIYHHLYQTEKADCFKQATQYWIEIGLTMDQHDQGLAGYSKYSTDGWQAEYGFLEGIAGILMVMLELLDEEAKVSNGWKAILLL